MEVECINKSTGVKVGRYFYRNSTAISFIAQKLGVQPATVWTTLEAGLTITTDTHIFRRMI